MKNLTLPTYKNREHSDESILIESDNDDEDVLNFMSQNLSSIPPQIALNGYRFVTTLILTNNRLETLENLKYFNNLISLQLDRNKLTNIDDLPTINTLNTLWLNNNNLHDLNSLLTVLQKQTPNLQYLSLMCNSLCPILNESKLTQHYRLNVVHCLAKLIFLDTAPVTIKERIKSQQMHNLSHVHSDAADQFVKYHMDGEVFRVYSYYKPIELVGRGAYGVVCSAIDRRNNKRVAIKKCTDLNESVDMENMLREIKVMSYFGSLRGNNDIVELYDCVAPQNNSFNEVYVIMPFYDSNLWNIIESTQQLSHLHFRYITYQILRGLQLMHKAGIFHRDIKPENIMLDTQNCKVKIIDFGMSRTMEEAKCYGDANIVEYPGTMHYRAPEIMCNAGRYSSKMDIWGVGCILAEMILKKPAFAGKSFADQLKRIFYSMHYYKNDINWISDKNCKQWLSKLTKPFGIKSLKQRVLKKFANIDNIESNVQCIDLLYKLLSLNPKFRISTNDALKHPYFLCVNDENIIDKKQKRIYFDFKPMQDHEKNIGFSSLLQAELYKIHKRRWRKINKSKEKRLSK